MQLSKIKLSGFKSFVDPTTLTLPSRLVAIVGPNGCGKSNIIDAVTWVMGESSPKYLRGEALTDVIFNGSSTRKTIGQASVELIFDNSDGSLGGEYRQFSEISIKRMINRESDSSYYLNGVRCRKRDVVGIFLGTGLGPRSYSIIGQNMISRVIEAKPDELRTYIEEAAGISKYKERRHETELRINRTKENLTRVNDLCLELQKQLSHLKHQANMAEKFKLLKQQERTLRAELYGIQWRSLNNRLVECNLHIERQETALAGRESELGTIARDLEQTHETQHQLQSAFQGVQDRYYALGNEITRLEQAISHHQERKQQWENELSQLTQDYQSASNQSNEFEDNLRDFEQEIKAIEPSLQGLNNELIELERKLQLAEEETQTWQTEWDLFNQASAKTSQSAQVEKIRIEHLEQQIAFLQKRKDQLALDEKQYHFSELDKELNDISKKAGEANHAQNTRENQLTTVKTTINHLYIKQTETSKELDQLHHEIQQLIGQQHSLEALQETALGQRNNPAAPWISKHQLDKNPRLAQHIQVEKGWELAVEKALGNSLQSICVDKLADITPYLADFSSGNICLFIPDEKNEPAKERRRQGVLLLDKIKSPWNLQSLLSGIYVADSVEEALSLCEELLPHESIMTQEGVWLNRTWLKVLRMTDPAAGLFAREEALKELALRIKEREAAEAELRKVLSDCRQQIEKEENKRDELQQHYNQEQAALAQLNVQLKMKEERLAELNKQFVRFKNEQEECLRELKKSQSDLEEAQLAFQKASQALEVEAEKRKELMAARDQSRHTLKVTREHTDQKKQAIHECEIRLQKALSQKSAAEQNKIRLKIHLTSLSDRKLTLQNELASMPPIDTLKKSLSLALDKHQDIQEELNTARNAVDAADQQCRNLEAKRQSLEKEMNHVRTTLEGLRVEWQGFKVRADTIVDQMKETELALETILEGLPNDITVEEWQTKLDQINNRIHRLGPINLVAIEEYATCSERKDYLDKQLDDLQSGLATLEEAISKIDKETKAKFSETFDKVNNRFKELFPTIFGGGKAYLELNSDDLLTAGVTMMACPPGKRNSSIYLLSGGEKSLTAIALIFSIFHLNPAPFCLLDEVDAALDDVNIIRFTRLVKAMADKTQFLFISHNKITIELGQHLIGVTMNEPGVSRLVSVDVEKAMSMAVEA